MSRRKEIWKGNMCDPLETGAVGEGMIEPGGMLQSWKDIEGLVLQEVEIYS